MSLRSSGSRIPVVAVRLRGAVRCSHSDARCQSSFGAGTSFSIRASPYADIALVCWGCKRSVIKRVTLPHVAQNTGTWLTPLTISPKTRTRAYAANVSQICFVAHRNGLISYRLKMYYEPHASRNNLVVLTSAHVARISLSKAASGDATAESVSFIHEGKEYRALVNKEVIVSAGYAHSLRPSGHTHGADLHLTIHLRAIMSPQVFVPVCFLYIMPHKRRF